MITRITQALLLTGIIFSLSACGTSPSTTLYALHPEPSPKTHHPAVKWQIEVRRPGLPGYLDRSQLVRRSSSGRVEFIDHDRWASPLGEMIGSTVARNLAGRFPQSAVYTENGAISAIPDVVVELDVEKFERTSAGTAELQALVALHVAGSTEAAFMKHFELTRSVSGGTDELVEDLSALIAELADAIALAIVELRARSTLEVESSTPQDPLAAWACVHSDKFKLQKRSQCNHNSGLHLRSGVTSFIDEQARSSSSSFSRGAWSWPDL